MTDINSTTSNNPFSSKKLLPIDAWATIFKHLAPKALANLKQTSQHLSAIINSNEITDRVLKPVLEKLNTLGAKISPIGKNNLLSTTIEGVKRVSHLQKQETYYLQAKHSGILNMLIIISDNEPNITLLEEGDSELNNINHKIILEKIGDGLEESLIIQRLFITRFPQSLMEVKWLKNSNYWGKLKILNCSHNQIATIPTLDACVALEELSCDTNRLTALPSLNACVALKQISCQNNQLTALPALDACVDLKQISCQNNQLTSLPSLNACAVLEWLECYINQITTLPALDACRNLVRLDCNNNQLTTLPVINTCLNLRVLNCSKNKLSALPKLDSCLALSELYCSDNQLTEPPESDILDRLAVFFCNNNRIANIPKNLQETALFKLAPQNPQAAPTLIIPAFNHIQSQNQVIENSATSTNKPNNNIIKPS